MIKVIFQIQNYFNGNIAIVKWCHVFFVMTLLATFGCSKIDSTQTNGIDPDSPPLEGSSRVIFSGQAAQLGPKNLAATGGVMVWGFQLGGANEVIRRVALHLGTTRSKVLPNGRWRFYAMGWTGTNPMTGQAYCGFLQQDLTGTDVTLKMNLTRDKSSLKPCGPEMAVNLVPVSLVTCNSISNITDATTNCDNQKGLGKSFRVGLGAYEVREENATHQETSFFASACQNISTSATATSTTRVDTGILIPAKKGDSNSIRLETGIIVYRKADCATSSDDLRFNFPAGLEGGGRDANGKINTVYKFKAASERNLVFLNDFPTNLTALKVKKSTKKIPINMNFNVANLVEGGQSPYTYNLTGSTNAGGVAGSSPDLNGSQFKGATASTSTITITDAKNQSVTLNMEIVAPKGRFNFTGGTLPSGFTFSRLGEGTYWSTSGTNNDGAFILRNASTDTARFETDSDGNNLGLLVEKEKVNFLRASSVDTWTYESVSATHNLASPKDPANLERASSLVDNYPANNSMLKHSSSIDTSLNNLSLPYQVVFSAFFKRTTTTTDSRYVGIEILDSSGSNCTARVFDLNANPTSTASTISLPDTPLCSGSSESDRKFGMQVYANGWKRIFMSHRVTEAAGSSFPYVKIFPAANLTTYEFSGTSAAMVFGATGAVYFYGGQLEVGNYPTSYIPASTIASLASTRGGDKLEMIATTGSTLFNSSSGAVRLKWRQSDNSGSDPATFFVMRGSTNNDFYQLKRTNLSKVEAEIYNSSTVSMANESASVLLMPGSNGFSYSYDNDGSLVNPNQTSTTNKFKFLGNLNGGTHFQAGSPDNLPSGLNSLFLGSDREGKKQINSHLQRFDYFAVPLDDDVLKYMSANTLDSL
jgi:hypothetical protein